MLETNHQSDSPPTRFLAIENKSFDLVLEVGTEHCVIIFKKDKALNLRSISWEVQAPLRLNEFHWEKGGGLWMRSLVIPRRKQGNKIFGHHRTSQEVQIRIYIPKETKTEGQRRLMLALSEITSKLSNLLSNLTLLQSFSCYQVASTLSTSQAYELCLLFSGWQGGE